MKNAAAIILCAGKGTRMNDNSKNKVCFDCAGVPVIRRIIDNMKKGGVKTFAIVIGHNAYSVMDTLDGVDGVVYAYQKEQKGTGHAALCGLKALASVGYSGPAIVSMGDKIIAPDVVKGLLEQAESAKAVWGVQPIKANPNGGRIIVADGKPYGVVEFADAALAYLANVSPDLYAETLKATGLNAKKAEKVMKKALAKKPEGTKILGGREFRAEDILFTEYTNAGLYCFDTQAAIDVVSNLGSDNAQGEIYLTDALEVFSQTDDAVLHRVMAAEDMLTYSTKEELRDMSRHFMRTASELIGDIRDGKLDGELTEIYRESVVEEKERYIALLGKFIASYGDRKVVITRAPGRINLMGRHIDHRGGGVNVMATDKDTVFVSSPRDDDRVSITNTKEKYRDRSFSIGEELAKADHSIWVDYLNNETIKNELEENRGDWSNYVKGAVLRAQLQNEMKLCGMDMAADGNIPVAAGLSSSSSIVVAVTEAVTALNCLNIPDSDFINICGEGEWFVGSRGGAGDHAAIKCGKRGRITHLGFKPFAVGESAEFSDDYAVIVANSMVKSKKSAGSRDKFNAKIAAYEVAFMLIKRAYPEYDFREFRDIASVPPQELYRMLKVLPESVTRDEIRTMLPEYSESIERIMANHSDVGAYDLRGVALFGLSECARSERFVELLRSGDYEAIGRMMKVSHNGDRITDARITDEYLQKLADERADIASHCGYYGCSTEQIDGLCDLLNGTDGVLGSEIVGAGLGGCVIALVKKDMADGIIGEINQKYYDAHGYEHAAYVYSASNGSSVLF